MMRRFGPGRLPLEHFIGGDDWVRRLPIKRDGTWCNLPRDGWLNIRAQWRPAAGAARFIDIDVDDSHAETGLIVLSLTGEQTEMMAGNGVYDVESTYPNGRTITRFSCETSWEQGVTR